MDTLLVVDDDRLTRWSVRECVGKSQELRVVEARTVAEAEDRLQDGVDAVVLDEHLPDGRGLDLVRRLSSSGQEVPIIMVTAHASVQHAVEAMNVGVFHYAPKPLDMEELSFAVDRALETTRLRREVARLREAEVAEFPEIIGTSDPIREVKRLIARVAQSPSSTVLITGETGTGKGLAARSVHRQSDRSEGPFQNITCSALASGLLGSELFGHERGAFTDASRTKKGLLELADQGTVFLDEIGEMDLSIQANLLRFLEEKVFRRVGGTEDLHADVRIVAATNADLREAVKAGTFREDLYFRLAVLTVELPPLRDRGEDVVLLSRYFAQRYALELGRSLSGISEPALTALRDHPWPGNVRELRNMVERAVLLAEGSILEPNDFVGLAEESVQRASPPAGAEPDGPFTLPVNGVELAGLERSLVRQALARTGGNQRKAAELLGMNRDQIRYRIKKYDLAP